jgi:glycosyltransferase involved in cell wall biosynthesis/glycogen synthase
MPSINPLAHPICLAKPGRLTSISSWHEHIPFAMWLVDVLRPRTICELGTHYGDSYCAFCQAVKELRLNTSCYAIDTWKGDPHSGFYGPDVLADLRTFHDPLYGSFSRLIQSTFDEALNHFKDRSIDLLHIDGNHTYEAVSHDFKSWLPKISAHGVVLFHDINVHESDFGVNRLWDEVKSKYSHFEFLYGHGLGILATGKTQSKAFLALLNTLEEDAEIIRNFFFKLGHLLVAEAGSKAKDAQINELNAASQAKDSQINELNAASQAKDSQINELNAASQAKDSQINELNNTLQTRDSQLTELNTSLQTKDSQAHTLETQISQMQQGIVWQLLQKWQRIVGKIFPPGTQRYYYYKLGLACIRIILNEDWRSFFFKFSQWFRKRTNRQINANQISDSYQEWIAQNEPKSEDLKRQKQESLSFGYQPKISIITPVWNPDARYLKSAIESVRNQTYDNWELCIVDGNSTKSQVKQALKDYALKDSRIKVELLPENKGIAGNSNEALSLAIGEFVGFLDHDDELRPNALYEIVKLLNEDRHLDLIYSDEDKIDTRGNRMHAFFKPDWSPDLLMSMNYICHLTVIRKNIINELGGFRSGFEGSQDYDLILRVTEKSHKIAHLSKPLYSWRMIPGSAATKVSAKSYAFPAAMKALRESLDRRGISGDIIEPIPGRYRVRYKIKGEPLVSIIIPTKDNVQKLERCIKSVESKTTYQNYEIIIIDHDSSDPKTIKYLKAVRHRIIKYNSKFNYSKMNNLGVSAAKGAHIVFLNDDTEVIEPGWLAAMLEHSQRQEVGMVGALLLYPPDSPWSASKIQHAGVMLGCGGVAGHAFKHISPKSHSYFSLHSVIRNCSAVTGACAMMRKDLFLAQGGFDENLPVAFNDIDLCLRLRDKGYLIIYTPFSVLYHYEGGTRGYCHPAEDETYMLCRWADVISKGDPYYNRNLTLLREDFSIPPRPSANIPLPLAVLLEIYYSRINLQRMFPEVADGKYGNLFDWAVEYGLTLDGVRHIFRPYCKWYVNNVSEALKPLAVFLEQYNFSSRLQAQFPEVLKHDSRRINSLRFHISHIDDPANAIVLVSHDAQTGGASLLALHLVKTMKEEFNKELVIILLQGGALENSFKQYGQVFNVQVKHGGVADNIDQAKNLIAALAASGVKYCILNTTVSGILVPFLKKQGFYVVSLIHELSGCIEILGIQESAKTIARQADKIIFATNFVKKQFITNYGANEEKTVIKAQGLYMTGVSSLDKASARQKLRQMIGAGKESFIFLGCGFADLRKGLDLFIQVARLVLKRVPLQDVHFLWVGDVDTVLKTWIEHDIEILKIKDRVHFLDYTSDILPIYSGSDIFLLTSREDPFPTVFMIAMDAGLPIIAFEDAGGAPEALSNGSGIVLPYLDTAAMADAAIELILNKDKRQYIAEKARQLIKQDYDFTKYVGFLLDVLRDSESSAGSAPAQGSLKTVSVIVPSYNYEKYLAERLWSIIAQTYKPYELIFLDDASNDKSVEVARDILGKSGIKFSIIENSTNEGVFNQWIKGFQLAKGELVWTAEADDICEPDFLEKLVSRFSDEEVNLAYTQSLIINENSEEVDYSYTSYTGDLSPDKWNSDYCQSGALEINDGLAIKNTIPNASAVIIRKSALKDIEDVLRHFRICGDWFTYTYVLRKGKISFCHEALNYHRRHSQSVINQSEKKELFYQELLAVQKFILNNYSLRSDVCERMQTHLAEEYRRLGCQGQKSRDILSNPALADEIEDLVRLCNKRMLTQTQRHKIMVIIPDLEFGGGQLFGIRLANFLSNTNDVFLYNARPHLENSEIRDTISRGVRLYTDTADPNHAADILANEGIDAVISNVWWSDKLAYFAIKEKKVRWVLAMHGCYEALAANPGWDSDFQRIIKPLLLRADHIVYTADKNLAPLESLGLSLKDKLIKINNGFLKPDGFITRKRGEFGVKDSDFIFGLISRAIPEKGWEQAILATKELNKILENRQVHLFIIGAGKYATDLKDRYADDKTLHFLGFQSNLAEWITMFDAGLLPSYFLSESQPLSIIEFIAHHKPVIATDIGEIRTMLIRNEKQAGILVPIVAGRVLVDDLFLAMKQLTFDEDRIYDKLSNNCEELFRPYDMKTCAEAYIALIEGRK